MRQGGSAPARAPQRAGASIFPRHVRQSPAILEEHPMKTARNRRRKNRLRSNLRSRSKL